MLKLWAASVKATVPHPEPELLYAILGDAKDVVLNMQINQDYTLEFSNPKNQEHLEVFNIIEYEGQLFRITQISRTEDAFAKVQCEHIFIYDAKRTHIPNIAALDSGDFIGEKATVVIDAVIKGTGFTKAQNTGLTEIDAYIDFESMDKTNVYDVLMKVIENAGWGELYVDNYSFLIAEHIGTERDIVVAAGNNLKNYTIEKDVSEMITRLYPYGKDNMEITNSQYNAAGLPYIKSKNEGGTVFSGYNDYSDCIDPDALYTRAMWEFDESNPDRLDIPAINISGTFIGGTEVELGDRVCFIEDGIVYFVRVISITRHPYDSEPDNISLGRIKRDMYYYLNRVGALTKRYKQMSTSSGKVQGNRISGSVTSKIKTSSVSASRISASNISSDIINIAGVSLSAGADGSLYISGKKVVLEESE